MTWLSGCELLKISLRVYQFFFPCRMKFKQIFALVSVVFFSVSDAVDLRKTSKMEVCKRHLRESRRILESAININDTTTKAQKAKIILDHFRQVEEFLVEARPELIGNGFFELVRVASSVPVPAIIWSVEYDPSFMTKLEAYLDFFETCTSIED